VAINRPNCPKCGAPARIAILLREHVRVEIDADDEFGQVLSVTREPKVIEGFECGGTHQWFVGKAKPTE